MARWNDFLQGAAPSGHAVQIYNDVDELADSVAAYLVAGFEAGDPGLVIATGEHTRRYSERLAAAGWDASQLEETGQLVVADAEETLDSFMVHDEPLPEAFEQVVGGLLDTVAARFPGGHVRAFGEMVDVLCERGQPEAAVRLEGLWNDMARRRRFSLLCGYRLNLFDRRAQVHTLPHVCRAHTHVLPAVDAERLEQAVDLALEEILGPQTAGKVYVVVRSETPETSVPMPQLILMWVSVNMPLLAERILASARTHYTAPAAA